MAVSDLCPRREDLQRKWPTAPLPVRLYRLHEQKCLRLRAPGFSPTFTAHRSSISALCGYFVNMLITTLTHFHTLKNSDCLLFLLSSCVCEPTPVCLCVCTNTSEQCVVPALTLHDTLQAALRVLSISLARLPNKPNPLSHLSSGSTHGFVVYSATPVLSP